MARTDQLLKRLRAARLDDTHDTELRRLIRTEVLILDDWCLQALDPADTANIYELVVERHRRATTIVTTNREPPLGVLDECEARLAPWLNSEQPPSSTP